MRPPSGARQEQRSGTTTISSTSSRTPTSHSVLLLGVLLVPGGRGVRGVARTAPQHPHKPLLSVATVLATSSLPRRRNPRGRAAVISCSHTTEVATCSKYSQE